MKPQDSRVFCLEHPLDGDECSVLLGPGIELTELTFFSWCGRKPHGLCLKVAELLRTKAKCYFVVQGLFCLFSMHSYSFI